MKKIMTQTEYKALRDRRCAEEPWQALSKSLNDIACKFTEATYRVHIGHDESNELRHIANQIMHAACLIDIFIEMENIKEEHNNVTKAQNL